MKIKKKMLIHFPKETLSFSSKTIQPIPTVIFALGLPFCTFLISTKAISWIIKTGPFYNAIPGI